MRGWIAAGVAVGVMALTAGAYGLGRNDGRNAEIVAQARLKSAAEAERLKLQTDIDALALTAARIESARQGAVREIHEKTYEIIDRPVYRNLCVDTDGVRIIDQAVAIANNQFAPVGGAATVPDPVPQP
ncbi:MAG: hypothetical protein QM645_11405 [Asticcacaulis sp.]